MLVAVTVETARGGVGASARQGRGALRRSLSTRERNQGEVEGALSVLRVAEVEGALSVLRVKKPPHGGFL